MSDEPLLWPSKGQLKKLVKERGFGQTASILRTSEYFLKKHMRGRKKKPKMKAVKRRRN